MDDVDSQIQYTGPWFPDQGSQDSVGNFGPPYLSTMHGTKSNASLSFAFQGVSFSLVNQAVNPFYFHRQDPRSK